MHKSMQAWKSWREGTPSNVTDPTLKNGSRTEIMRCIHIGLLCVQENLADKPIVASVSQKEPRSKGVLGFSNMCI
ncbi:putative non-specific serine/threonine protein kinase [Rosa chinensis]|uniref:Putative non-specific serine/threonine protein kinase n=1 Tax=Rosa chinensis TaxID=74649 RepID=A0A2P6RQY1_ROSCH|nr:putative non-specific serine/threonine protein kinase [Rosa chinensis]